MSDNSIAGAIWSKVHVVLALGLVGLAGILEISWLDARHAQSRLQATIESTNKTIAAAASQESARDEHIKTALAQIAQLKAKVKTPAQALAALPSALPKLPVPIEIQSSPSSEPQTESSGVTGNIPALAIAASATGTTSTTASSTSLTVPRSAATAPPPALLKIPQADLKPLYQAAEDCKSCEAELSTAQADLADSKMQLAAALSQRDAALRAAKGGTLWTRTKRAAKWLAIGALCGAVAAKSIH